MGQAFLPALRRQECLRHLGGEDAAGEECELSTLAAMSAPCSAKTRGDACDATRALGSFLASLLHCCFGAFEAGKILLFNIAERSGLILDIL